MDNAKTVLGISGLFHDSAAALVRGADILAAAQEERFSRKKGDWSFPKSAIDFCLKAQGTAGPADAVAFYENPVLKTDRIVRNAIDQAPRGARLWPQTLRTMHSLNEELPRLLETVSGDKERLFFVPHHRSHAASAFYPSPFDNAAVLIVDGVGEWSTTSIWSGTPAGLEPVLEMKFPHSIGLLYSAFTQYCGFMVNSGEYKMMGLAPFGQPIFVDRIRDRMIDQKPDGSFSLNMQMFDFATAPTTISPLFGYLFDQPARLPSEPITQHYMDVAASGQRIIEDLLIALAQTALQRTGARNLCMAGGVALNCVANGKIRSSVEGLDGFWIQPAAGDAGGALGAALEVSKTLAPLTPPPKPKSRSPLGNMSGAYLGPEFSDSDIAAALEAQGVVYSKPDSDETYCNEISDALANGQIIGHFDGPMEFGPRALGNRSILADPRPENTLNRVNVMIKFREGWRPFAPIILADQAQTYFELVGESPYMLQVAPLRAPYRGDVSLQDAQARGLRSLSDLQNAVVSDFSAVTHVDYSARIQTLGHDSPTRAYRILRQFHEQTGCPMLLNTSFNVRGEPIVCTPRDAVDCFLNTRIDVLAIGGFIARRSAQSKEAQMKVGQRRFNAD